MSFHKHFSNSEPTSITKSAVIIPAVSACLSAADASRSPVTFAAPNVLELAQIYRAAQSADLTAHDHWWKVVDNMALGSQFRMDLEQLARRTVSDEDDSKGTLSFLADEGVAQMAINLLPFFQHLVVKCGDRGVLTIFRVSGPNAQNSGWANEHSNIRNRCVVTHNIARDVITVLRHFPASAIHQDDIVNVTGAGDTLVGSILGRIVCAPDAFQNSTTLEELVAEAQRAAVLTLKSPYAVSPLL